MADVGIAVGVREVLRFVPDNGGIHAGEDSRAVASGEGCVETLDEIDVRLGHGKGLRYPEAVYRKTIPVDSTVDVESRRCGSIRRLTGCAGSALTRALFVNIGTSEEGDLR
jgi:hypothetical protein